MCWTALTNLYTLWRRLRREHSEQFENERLNVVERIIFGRQVRVDLSQNLVKKILRFNHVTLKL